MKRNFLMTILFLIALTLTVGIGAFAQSVDYSFIPYRSCDKWGFANENGQIEIAAKYDDAAWFSQGLAAVKSGKKWGYINKEGKLVIPAKYTVAKSFRRGYIPNNSGGGDSVVFAGASLRTDGYEICINQKGISMPKCPAIPENSVAENQIPVKTYEVRKTYTVENKDGLFDEITDDYKNTAGNETYYIARKSGKYGVFNSKFEIIIPFDYDQVKLRNAGSSNPYLEVKRNDLLGMSELNGNELIPTENSSLELIQASDGKEYLVLQRGGKYYVKTRQNQDLVAEGYEQVHYDDHGFVTTGENNLQGYYFVENNRRIPPKYQKVEWMDGGRYLRITTTAGKKGYINKAGDEYFKD